MFDTCECGNNCPVCEECGFPECECDCQKIKKENEEDELEW